MSNDYKEKLSDELETVFEPSDKNDIVPSKPEVKSITRSDEDRQKQRYNDLNKDYSEVRSNLKGLISTGSEAIEGILRVAQEGDAPRAYEVVSQMLKTVSDMNKDLLVMHDQMKKITQEDTKVTNNSTTNNAIYVGSTSDLQDLINTNRSRKKIISDDIVVDAEIIDDKQT
jgi:hypothetical protein